MLATCSCAHRSPAPSAARPAAPSRLHLRRAARAAAGKGQPGGSAAEEEDLPQTLPRASAPAEVPETDFWEGERFEWVGNVASVFIPLLVVLAVGVGFFASQTYNEGATVFLDAPKSTDDSARLVPAQQLQQLP